MIVSKSILDVMSEVACMYNLRQQPPTPLLVQFTQHPLVGQTEHFAHHPHHSLGKPQHILSIEGA